MAVPEPPLPVVPRAPSLLSAMLVPRGCAQGEGGGILVERRSRGRLRGRVCSYRVGGSEMLQAAKTVVSVLERQDGESPGRSVSLTCYFSEREFSNGNTIRHRIVRYFTIPYVAMPTTQLSLPCVLFGHFVACLLFCCLFVPSFHIW